MCSGKMNCNRKYKGYRNWYNHMKKRTFMRFENSRQGSNNSLKGLVNYTRFYSLGKYLF